MLLLLAVVVSSCGDDNGGEGAALLSPGRVEVDARCQELTVVVAASEGWQATTDDEWLTPEMPDGRGDAEIPVYIQQNDGGEARTGVIDILTESGQTLSVTVVQIPSDDNGANAGIPQNFGVGWGYDLSADVADVAGLRAQIIDAAKLRQLTGLENCVEIGNATSSHYLCASEKSTVELCNYLSTKLTGEIDLKIAGAKVSAEFEKQTTDTKNRYYLWYRNIYQVKYCAFSVGMYNPKVTPYATTLDFKKAIYALSPEEFVKKYGTHVITSSGLGGKLDFYMTVAQDIKETVERITLTVSVRFLCWKATATSVDEKLWNSISQSLTGRYYCAGGGAVGAQLNSLLEQTVNQGKPTMPDGGRCTLFEDWAACFGSPGDVPDSDLAIVSVDVFPVADIVSMISPVRGEMIDRYVREQYLK